MISVIIPSHKEPHIQEFIKSVEEIMPGGEIIISNDRYGKGKGWALREALKQSKYGLVVFLDGDGDIEPRMLLRLLPFLNDYEAVVGSKRINHKHFGRRILTLLSRIYIRLMFNVGVDSQTGIKLFHKNMIGDWKTDGFFVDVEILSNVIKNGGRIIEVPVEAEIKSKMSWGAIWSTLKESLILKFRLSFRRKR